MTALLASLEKLTPELTGDVKNKAGESTNADAILFKKEKIDDNSY